MFNGFFLFKNVINKAQWQFSATVIFLMGNIVKIYSCKTDERVFKTGIIDLINTSIIQMFK